MRRSIFVGVVGIAGIAIAAAFAHESTGERPAAARPPPSPAPVKPVLAKSAPPLPPPRLDNLAAYIPVQCYARTRIPGRAARNACATCHQEARVPNYVDDADVQTTSSMPRYAIENRWTNALHPPAPAAIDDRSLLAWVRADNYHGADGAPAVRGSAEYTPDCAFAPDAAGWDRDPRGVATGWRAYASAPVPGMFWPTNGSAGDVFIRLPDAYRRDATGQPSDAIYSLNLAIVEASVRQADVPIATTDEAPLGVDLDGDGRLGVARRVKFAWPQLPGRPLHYVGQAASLDPAVTGWPAAGLYPVGTELIHSLRYLDVVDGRVRPAARMKEVRYMRKLRWLTYSALDLAAKAEQREREQDPDSLRHVFGDGERGVGTGGGWKMLGFIEAADGALRTQTLEETAACIGCHGGVGATTDGTFSLARKVTGTTPDAGWYAWGARGFTGIAEPVRADGRGEYRTWLEAVGAGDDFGGNDEVARRFLAPDGTVRPEMARALAKDISVLVVPSPDRALALDRAYLAIARAQSFARGRDAFVGTPEVEARLEQGAATGVVQVIAPPWKPAAAASTP
jgi:hypothetical protein